MYTDLKICFTLFWQKYETHWRIISPITDTSRAAIKTRGTIKLTEQCQWHFSNNFILLTGGLSKITWKSLKELVWQYFQKQCWPVGNGFWVFFTWYKLLFSLFNVSKNLQKFIITPFEMCIISSFWVQNKLQKYQSGKLTTFDNFLHKEACPCVKIVFTVFIVQTFELWKLSTISIFEFWIEFEFFEFCTCSIMNEIFVLSKDWPFFKVW